MDKWTKVSVCGLMIILCLHVVMTMDADEAENSKITDPCYPNPCENHGHCQPVKNQTLVRMGLYYTCVCTAPSYGTLCEISNGLRTDWLLSLSYSIPISVLLLVCVLYMYKLGNDKRKQRKEKSSNVQDYWVADVMTKQYNDRADVTYGNDKHIDTQF